MAIRLRNLTLEPDEPDARLREKAATELGLPPELITQLQVARRSLDARGRHLRFVYTVILTLSDPSAEADVVQKGKAAAVEIPEAIRPAPGSEEVRGRVVVAGCGPAGLFAGLQLARLGYRPLLVERGAPIAERHADVSAFLANRELNPDSNVLFGAGGAGTYSDGKLHSRIRDSRVRHVLETFVRAGAPGDLLIDAKPHVGTDLLHGVVANMCRDFVSLGGEIRWRTRLTGLTVQGGRVQAVKTGHETIETNCLIPATGANARDTFAALLDSGLAMEPKPFQMGLRIEHPRELIDRAIYGPLAGHVRLGAADYVLSARAVTAFCVCPGGVLVAACCEPGAVCTNGMSGHARDSEFTNAALVTTVSPEEFGAGPLAGLEYQRRWENSAFRLGGEDYSVPAQNAPDFLSRKVRPLGRRTSYPLGARPARLETVVPGAVGAAIAQALPDFERRIRGFAGDAGILVGPEARASCPVRIARDPKRRVSVSVDGVYPAGEGSGYSSGIMSSAVDGLKAAEAVILRFAVPRY